LSKIIDFLTGSMGSSIVEGAIGIISKRFPGKISEAEQEAFNFEMAKMIGEQANKAAEIAVSETKEFNDRIESMEGTASDLKAMPILGPAMLFLRGAQRPAWSIATMWFDYNWFGSNVIYSEQQQSALIAVNMLVLGFLFGERAIKNLEPLLTKLFAKG